MKMPRWVYPVVATIILGSYGFTWNLVGRAEAQFAAVQEQVREQIQETKEDIEKRLERMENRNFERSQAILQYLKEMRQEIHDGNNR